MEIAQVILVILTIAKYESTHYNKGNKTERKCMKMMTISMQGIMEDRENNKRRIKDVLVGEPAIVRDYASCFTDQRLRTEYRYLLTVKEFCKNISTIREDVDVNRPETFGNLRTRDINKYMESIKVGKNGEEISPEFFNHKRAVIWNFFKYLVAEEYVTKNVVDNVGKLKSNKVHEYIYLGQNEDGDVTLESIRDAIEEVHHKILTDKGRMSEWSRIRNIAIIDLFLAAGLRCHELIQLDIDSIVFGENGTSHLMVVGKGNKPEVVFFNDRAAESLKAWLSVRETLVDGNNKAVFISRVKKRITEKCIGEMVKKYTGLTPHKLRATAGMIVYLMTKDIEQTAKFLRHSNISTTRGNYVTATRGQMISNSFDMAMLWGVA